METIKFEKYMHIERYGSSKVLGIEKGKCYIFPKLDGGNTQAWLNEKQIKVGQRNRETDDSHGGDIRDYIQADTRVEALLNTRPDLRLFGEWLSPHTIRDYKDDAWGKFYIFDVRKQVKGELEEHLSYDEYSKILDKYGLEYIKPIAVINKPTTADFEELLNTNRYLIDESKDTIGEGIVIKNYEYISPITKGQLYAKIVRSEFIAKLHNLKEGEILENKVYIPVEEQIALDYFTDAFIEKEDLKAIDIVFNGNYTSKESRRNIPKLFDYIFYEFVEEDMVNVLKEYKNPDISFTKLYDLCRQRIKEVSKVFKK